jgi:hypothetical protein
MVIGFPAKLYAVIDGPNVVDSRPAGDPGIDRLFKDLSTQEAIK